MTSSTANRSLLRPRAAAVLVERDSLRVRLRDGRELVVPIEWFGWLASASARDRLDVRIVEDGAGLWWEGLEDGVSVPWLFGVPEVD